MTYGKIPWILMVFLITTQIIATDRKSRTHTPKPKVSQPTQPTTKKVVKKRQITTPKKREKKSVKNTSSPNQVTSGVVNTTPKKIYIKVDREKLKSMNQSLSHIHSNVRHVIPYI